MGVLVHMDTERMAAYKRRVIEVAAELGMDSSEVMLVLAEVTGGIAANLDRLDAFHRQPFEARMRVFTDHALATYERASRHMTSDPSRVVTRRMVQDA